MYNIISRLLSSSLVLLPMSKKVARHHNRDQYNDIRSIKRSRIRIGNGLETPLTVSRFLSFIPCCSLIISVCFVGDADMLRNLGENGVTQGKFNISFLSMFLLGDLEKCLEILIQTNRIPEAAFFAR